MDRNSKIQEFLDNAWKSRRIGDLKASKNYVTNAHELCNEDDHEFLGRIYHIYRQFESDEGHFQKALLYNKKSLAYYEKSNNRDRIAHSIRHLADLQVELKEFNNAEKNYTKSIYLYKANATRNDHDLSNALRGYAILLELEEKYVESIEIWKDILTIYQTLNYDKGIAEVDSKIRSLENNL